MEYGIFDYAAEMYSGITQMVECSTSGFCGGIIYDYHTVILTLNTHDTKFNSQKLSLTCQLLQLRWDKTRVDEFT